MMRRNMYISIANPRTTGLRISDSYGKQSPNPTLQSVMKAIAAYLADSFNAVTQREGGRELVGYFI